MNSIIIQKTGRTKKDLLNCLELIKNSFANEINDNKVDIKRSEDGYNIHAEKRILLFKFWVDAIINAFDGYFELSWQTNAPEDKVSNALSKIREILEKC